MKHDDLAERALELLRREHGPVLPDPALEARLMRRHAATRPARRARWPWIIGALSLCAGASFAAAGGVEWVRGWIYRVEVDGRALEERVEGPGARAYAVETADGGRASVRISRKREDGATRTRLAIDRVGPAGVEVERGEHVVGGRVGELLPLEALGGRAPFFRSADGGLELYALGEPGGARLLVRRVLEDPAHARELARLPVDATELEARAEVREVAGGGLVLELEREPGAVFALAIDAPGHEPAPAPVRLETADGAIRVEVQDDRPGDREAEDER